MDSDSTSYRTDLDAVRERAEKASRYITDLCQGHRRWTMTVPVDLERDDDVVLGAVVGDARQPAAEVERLRDGLADALDQWEQDGSGHAEDSLVSALLPLLAEQENR